MSCPSYINAKPPINKTKTKTKTNLTKKNDKEEKLDETDVNISFILKKTKTSGNYSILRKTKLNGFDTLQRVRYTIYSAYLPFGKEEYNDNAILNAVINDSLNINHNMLIVLNRVTKTFDELNTIDSCKVKYGIGNKQFFPFIKEVTPDPNKIDKIDNIDKPDKPDKPIKQYSIRLYFKYGAKVTHAKLVGELSYDQLKGKRCDINIELGSMWVNESIMMYGINIYITHITVLN